jgi:regulator of cell morphogenesis and NO signaling
MGTMTAPPLHDFSRRSLATLVQEVPRAAAIFERFGLDFCCGGQRTLEDAARARHVPLDEVVKALAEDQPRSVDDRPANEDDLAMLIHTIVTVHHRYVREMTPTINHWLDKLVRRHGTNHPELEDVRETFRALGRDLESHMAKEEHILFPFIRDLVSAARAGETPAPIGTIIHPVRVMKAEHRHAGELLDRLRTVTGGYAPPADACTTYRSCYAELERFERDLHRHVHLENNVLFPGAVALEARLA